MNDSPGRPSPGPEDAGPPDSGAPDSGGLPGQARPPAAENIGEGSNASEPGGTPGPDLNKPPAPGAPQGQTPGGQVPPPPPPPGHGPGYGPVPGQPGWGPGPGGPGYGQGPYGHPGAAWNVPPAPKPGVIPLRPLNVGDIFEGAFATLRKHWRPALTVSAVVSIAVGAASTLVEGRLLRSPAYADLLSGRQPTRHDITSVFSNLAVGSSAEVLIALIGQIVATSMLIMLVSRAVLGRTATIGEIWRDALPRMPRLLGLLLAVGLMLGLVLGVGILPGAAVAASGSSAAGVGLVLLGLVVAMFVVLWLSISFSLATPALMLERQGVFASLARSFKLVRGSWWRIFGILVLSAILSYVVSGIMQAVMGAFTNGPGVGGNPFTMLTTHVAIAVPSWTSIVLMGVGSVIASLFVMPMSAGVTSLLYMDQRIRREGLDVELAAAAGVQAPPAY